MSDNTKPITATIPKFLDISGIGRSVAYELLKSGELKSIKVGRRRLIVVDSYREFVERQSAAAAA